MGNVLYKSMGSGVFIEDGSEVHNNITDNLSVWVRIGLLDNNVSNPRGAFPVFCNPRGFHDGPALAQLDCKAPGKSSSTSICARLTFVQRTFGFAIRATLSNATR